jgi:methyltransferase (TIGR00027 family)
MNLTLPIASVADTSFLTAMCRAYETERPDAHFRDPYARKLAGTRGEEFLQRLMGGGASSSGCIVRTCLIDAFILEIIKQAPIDTVLNLGAGLDTRPYRLPLPASMSWIEVDVAGVLTYKMNILDGHRPACAVQRVAMDVTDCDRRRKLLQQIATTSEQVLVLAEGLLVYMKEEQVASLARDLSELPQFRWWLSDVASPSALRLTRKGFSDCSEHGGVPMLFAPEEGPGFFQQYGWHMDEVRLCLEEGRRLQRPFLPEAQLAQLSPEQREVLRKLSAVVKLKRAEPKSSIEAPADCRLTAKL